MILETRLSLEKHEFASPQEAEQSYKLGNLQILQLKNLLASLVEEKMALSVMDMKGDNTMFALAHEFARGQITILQYIIACSETT
jgi:hypothetical protein